jgi:type IV fimbrial biogenesis protein FimT
MLTRPAARIPGGFTLIELLVVIAIVGIIIVATVPAMRGLIENGRIRVAGESWKYGLALARAEAVRRNTQVEFVTSATGWQVRRVLGGQVLHQGSGKEGTTGLDLTIAPDGADRVTYNPFGRTVAVNPSDGSEPIAQVDFAAAVPPPVSGYKPLRVQVLASGMSRLCDPAADTTDPRVCL